MAGAKGDPQVRRPRLRRFGERIGFLISPEQRTRQEQEAQATAERSRNEWEYPALVRYLDIAY
jgi:hypothetical protein